MWTRQDSEKESSSIDYCRSERLISLCTHFDLCTLRSLQLHSCLSPARWTSLDARLTVYLSAVRVSSHMLAAVPGCEDPGAISTGAQSINTEWIVGGHFPWYENGELRVFSCFVHFLVKQIGINSETEKCIEYGSSDSQIDKPQRGRPKRAELLDVNHKHWRAKH